MLTKLREGASSWPAKVILCVVALSFVGWGVGDIFVSRGETTVAEVGDDAIDVRDLQVAYRNRVRSLQTSGVRIDPGTDLARRQARLALEQLVQDTLLDQAAGTFGITASDATLRAAIVNNEMFHGVSGNFDSNVFAGVLSMNGLTEETYLASLSRGIARSQLIASLGALPSLPDELVRRITQYRQEERTAELAVIPNDVLVARPEPQDAELASWFADRSGAYDAPEYRSASYLLIYAEDIAGTIEIAPEEIEAAYDATPDRWVEPERRLVRQARFATREEAEESLATAFEETAPGQSEARWLRRDDLLEELAEPVFAATVGDTAGPVESPLGGWLTYRIDEVEARVVTPLEEAHDIIRGELALAQARYALFDLADDLDDLIATGASPSEMASTLGLELKTVEGVSASGLTRDAGSLQIVPETPEFLEEVFLARLDFVSTVLETDDGGLLVVEVTEIVPARARTLDEVRNEALSDWQAERQTELATREANRLAGSAGSTGDLNDVFGFAGVTFLVTEPFMRHSMPPVANISFATVEALFDARPGDTVVRTSEDGSHQVVARLVDVINAVHSPEDVSAVGARLRQGVIRDISEGLVSSLHDDVTVSINDEMIDQSF
ncbi:MAG: SurA N-terminal domain-containing protein [bacterium]|nr:SurA N-terminal domain-containing protein [bacterium]